MGVVAGVGFSDRRNPVQAARMVIEQAQEQLGGDAPPAFAILMATVGYHVPDLVARVREILPGVPMVGCSAEGVISSAGMTEGSHGVALALFRSDDVQFVPFGIAGLREDCEGVGAELAAQLGPRARDGKPVGLMLLADGLSFNYTAFSRGLFEKGGFPADVPLFGGMAADNFKFVKTFQFLNDEVLEDGVVGALLLGDTDLHLAVTHGCSPIGIQRTITEVDGNIIVSIDGIPALQVLKEYVGHDINMDNWGTRIPSVAIGVRSSTRASDSDDEFTIRFFTGMDAERETLTVSAEVPEGTPFWVMRRNLEKMQEGNARIVEKLRPVDERSPDFVFHIDCAGRGISFLPEDEVRQLVTRLRDAIAPETPWLGMFSFGELAPVDGTNRYHSFTCVAATFR